MNKKILLNDKDWEETVEINKYKHLLIIKQRDKKIDDTRGIVLNKTQAELLRQFLNKNVKKMKK